MAKFEKTECVSICFFALAVFSIALMVCLSDTSVYGDVIYSESEEWNKYPIVDVAISSEAACPSLYEMV